MTGSGTAADPYVIYDATDLQAMENSLSAYYILGNNIDASETSGWNGGDGFDPVGSSGTEFSGYFDGKDYTISDLFIDRSAEDDVALFGRTSVTAGYIRNVGLVNCDITGSSVLGALVAERAETTDPDGGVVSDCYSTGAVKGDYKTTGGLIGYSGTIVRDCHSECTVTITGTTHNITWIGGFAGKSERDITRCYATGAITITGINGGDISAVGGFVGTIDEGTVSRCFATGDITANMHATGDDISGIGGFAGSNRSEVEDCYAKGDITATPGIDEKKLIGGFVGYNFLSTINSYSIGSITAAGFSDVGGFCGDNADTITSCFWDTEASGESTSDGGTGKTTAQMKDIATFQAAGWAISRIWNITAGCNNGYPCLIYVNACCSAFNIGDLTIIGNKVSLEAIRNIEMVYGGRFYISKSGSAIYESRYHRNV